MHHNNSRTQQSFIYHILNSSGNRYSQHSTSLIKCLSDSLSIVCFILSDGQEFMNIKLVFDKVCKQNDKHSIEIINEGYLT